MPTPGCGVLATILADLRGIARLGYGLLRGSITVPFLGQAGQAAPPRPGRAAAAAGRVRRIGVASTVAYIALYLLLRGALPAQLANALSLLATTVGNTAANRRCTFGIRGRHAHAGIRPAGCLPSAPGCC